MSKKRIFLVGEHPYGVSGNSHMMQAIIDQLDTERYSAVCYSETPPTLPHDLFSFPKVPVIPPIDPGDQFGTRRLIEMLSTTSFDMLLTVGVDLWHFSSIFESLLKLRKSKRFVFASIFPYDLNHLRDDWAVWIRELDVPCVYSEYGFNLLKDHVPNLQFYKPPLAYSDLYFPRSEEERMRLKRKHFSGEDKGRFIFGFIGMNQVRKDPQRAIRAFFELKKEIPDISLYFHTNIQHGVYNISQYIEDCGGKRGDILIKNQSLVYPEPLMSEVYGAIDCLLNTSLQEGLSWTLLNAMLSKTPIVAANNTAQVELLEGGCGFSVNCDEIAYLPVVCGSGVTHVETQSCNFSELVTNMRNVVKNVSLREQYVENAYKKVLKRIEETSNVNDLLDSVFVQGNLLDSGSVQGRHVVVRKPKEGVLFMQHSAAGDVFMTTRCFKGLKERHGGIPFYYMTQSAYRDIIEGNPYVDEILDWNPHTAGTYSFIYNPHGDRILPGNWGRNCNSILSDFYWKILNVEPDDFYIQQVVPPKEVNAILDYQKPWLIVHTTGGDPKFRTYKYMKDVCAEFTQFQTIQVGGAQDYPAGADVDLRGKLSYRQTAWVMERASFAVTVDSFISHLAGAFGVSQVCLFGSGNHVVVRPNQVQGHLICMSPDYVRHCPGLGPCSGAVLDCHVPCTSRHNPSEVITNVYELIERVGVFP